MLLFFTDGEDDTGAHVSASTLCIYNSAATSSIVDYIFGQLHPCCLVYNYNVYGVKHIILLVLCVDITYSNNPIYRLQLLLKCWFPTLQLQVSSYGSPSGVPELYSFVDKVYMIGIEI